METGKIMEKNSFAGKKDREIRKEKEIGRKEGKLWKTRRKER